MKERLAGKKILGLEIRTINLPNRAEKQIPELWNQFFQENAPQKIERKKNNRLIALYTDYKKDHTQSYTYILGFEVESLDKTPEGFTEREIAPATYMVFYPKGPYPESLLKTWQKIWQSSYPRSYLCDMEIYPPDFDATSNPTYTLYLGINT